MRGVAHAIAPILLALTVLCPVSSLAAPLSFADLPGWDQDDQGAALRAFVTSCPALADEPEWAAACAAAPRQTDARAFFERYFRPVAVPARGPTLFTGYYEPELQASPVRTARFAYPIYRKPPELQPGEVWYDRATIEGQGLLAGRGLELAWLADPVDVFFLQVQGSGRLVMPDGHVMRVGFAAKNNRPYRSIGRELADRGVFPAARISARMIRNWIHANPADGRALMWTNPSYVFFRPVSLDPALGPIGGLAVPVTAGRTLAVDPRHVPLGAPVWIDTDGNQPMRRLMVAQDVGTAIKGPERADVFVGSGFRAGELAGSMRDSGRMFVLMPLAGATLANAGARE